MNAPRLSILIPTLDAHGVRLDGLPPDAEVLVFVNGAESRPEIPGARVFSSPINLGYALAVNELARMARAPFLLFLNDDAALEPGAVDKLIAFLNAHPKAAAAGAQLLDADGRPRRSHAALPTRLRALFGGPRGAPGPDGEVESLVGAAMMVRSTAWDEIGPFDERFFVFLEETYWCHVARWRGWTVHLVPDARVRHVGGATKSRFGARGHIEYVASLLEYLRAGPLFLVVYFLRTLLAYPLNPVRYGPILAWLACGRPWTWGIRGVPTGYRSVGDAWVRDAGAEAIVRDLDAAFARGRVVKSLRRKRTVEVDGYFVRFTPGRRAMRELILAIEAERRRIPCVAIAAAGVHRGDGFVVVKKIAAERLDRFCQGHPEQRPDLALSYGHFGRWLHDAGLDQHDFNPTNILAADHGCVPYPCQIKRSREDTEASLRALHDAMEPELLAEVLAPFPSEQREQILRFVSAERAESVRRLIGELPADVVERARRRVQAPLQPYLTLIDFERTRLGPPVSDLRRVEALARLDRIAGVSRWDRARFLHAYAGRDFRRWAEWIAREEAWRRPEWEAKIRRACLRDGRNFGKTERHGRRMHYRKADPETGMGGLTNDAVEALLAREIPSNGLTPRDALCVWVESQVAAWRGDLREPPLAVLLDRARGAGQVLFSIDRPGRGG